LNLGPRAHIGQFELSKIGYLNVADRVQFLRLNHVFKINSESAAPYLSQHFTRVSTFHNHNTRGSSFNFVVPAVKGHAAKTFYYNAIKDWNKLPNNIKSIINKDGFKRAMKEHLSIKAGNVAGGT
jgi:hypothetical protein